MVSQQTRLPRREYLRALGASLALAGALGFDLVGRGIARAAPATRPASRTGGQAAVRMETIAEGLVAPWSIVFKADDRIFVTERPGRVRVIQDGVLRSEPVVGIPDVADEGEGGLLGMALDPQFSRNQWVYLYHTYRADDGLRNRVVRYVEKGDQVFEDSRQVLLDGIPGASIHDGGRIAFGPDGRLYVTTGDATRQPLAQDLSSLAGKILRINPDGSIPDDNPFPGSPVYSYGHRNAQGLAWQPGTGRLYATEHGPTGNDEVNVIEPGQNYGWPEAQGRNHQPPVRAPLVVYESAIAPCGAAFYDGTAIPEWRGSLLFATLRGAHLHRLILDAGDPPGVASEERLYDGELGRLREVVQGPDGALYITTSNRDGRGRPAPGDDRVLRIAPQWAG